MLKVAHDFGFESVGLSERDFLIEGNIIQIGYPPLRIDLLNEIDGVRFEDCFQNKVIVRHDGFSYNFISYEDLLKNKAASGRF